MSDLHKMPPIFCIGKPSASANASNDSLGVQEIDWTHSEQAASLAFTYGWVRASDAKYLVESIERLRARVEELERVRAAAQALIDYEDAGPDAPGGMCWMKWEEKFQTMRDALKETAP